MRQVWVPNRVNPLMHTVPPPSGHSPFGDANGHPPLRKLPQSHNPVLRGGKLSNQAVNLPMGRFPTIWGGLRPVGGGVGAGRG